jgi:hypothetical protein
MSRVSKQQLILPTILVLAGIEKIYDDYNLSFSGLSTTVAKEAVISGIKDKLSEEDLEKMKSRNDRRIDQTFRNLISHKDLLKNDIVSVSDLGRMRLTENGFNILFDYFNSRLERAGVEKFPELETKKRSVYNQLNSRHFPVRNDYIEDLNNKVRDLIKSKLENSTKKTKKIIKKTI